MSYATDAELSAHLSPTKTALPEVHDLEVTQANNTAIEAIVSYCGQEFEAATVDSTQYLWPEWDRRDGCWTVRLKQPMHSITSVTIDDGDDGTYETTWVAGTDYLALPRGGVRDGITGWPTTDLRVASQRTMRTSGFHEQVKIIGKIGWTTVPHRVKTAQLFLASQLKAQNQTTNNVVAFGEYGAIRLDRNTYAYVAGLLGPLCLVGSVGFGGIA